MKIRNIVFDLDGTLLYTLQDLCDSVNYVLKKNNEPERTIAEIRRFVGNGVHKLMERSVPAGTSAEDLEIQYNDFKAYYAAHDRDTTKPFDGIPELLTELHRRGIGVAVVTNKFQGAAEPLMEDYFGDLIDVTVGAAEGVPHKPQPLMVYKAMNLLAEMEKSGAGTGTAPDARAVSAGQTAGKATVSNAAEKRLLSDPSVEAENVLLAEPSAETKAQTLYIGDSTVDAATAENSGLSYLLCDWGYNDRDILEQQHALAIISRPEEALGFL